MFPEKLKENHKFAVSFFEASIKKGIGHAYTLTGSDTAAQYFLALETARIINCEKGEDNPLCNCKSCEWIKQNRHPAVITISPIDFDEVKKGKSKTVISADQARELKSKLLISSPFHRVVILTDAEEGAELEEKAKKLFGEYNFGTPKKDEEERIWICKPLSSDVFGVESANTLLKILEEPLTRVVFFFLTRNKSDIIETMISRCQVVPVTARFLGYKKDNNILEIAENLPPTNAKEALMLAEKFLNKSKELMMAPEELLRELQTCYRQVLSGCSADRMQSQRIINAINLIEETKNRLNALVNPQNAIDDMFMMMAGR